MDEEQKIPQEQEEIYQERPQWQVWAARVGLVLFLLLIAMYYTNIARGGA